MSSAASTSYVRLSVPAPAVLLRGDVRAFLALCAIAEGRLQDARPRAIVSPVSAKVPASRPRRTMHYPKGPTRKSTRKSTRKPRA